MSGILDGSGEVEMICNSLDIPISVRIEMSTALALIAGYLNDVIQVRNHTSRDECITVIIEIESPGITGPVSEYFKLVAKRMKAPRSFAWQT